MELTHDVLDCMQRLRRRLREEQTVDIRLSQPDAVSRMLEACVTSPVEETRLLGERLSLLSGVRPPLTEAQLIEKYTRYAGPLRG